MQATLLSLAVLGMFALLWGGVVQLRRGVRHKGALMLAAALVVLGNLLIWTL